ncbi:MAG TPA: glycoside hydrolase family 2 TIM barrel-domain containing protein [Verrucomicrobiae bacterium]|jgi:exo-1,4-beta-D-glucosaminidase|nr:glycoside hydrolase family 2 TIM barrel-domain containing protein [Verrucomicrobiae bacterium]
MRTYRFFILAAAILGWLGYGGANTRAQAGDIIPLEQGWQIRPADPASTLLPSVALVEKGQRFNAPALRSPGEGGSTSEWYPANVPTTVLGTLVDDGVYTNIYFGTNFARITRGPFTNAWWFQDEFTVSDKHAAENADLIFDGINYRANIWLNGKQIGATNEIFGAYRIFTLDATGKLKAGTNNLAVEVFPPQPGDFTMGFVDWNPWPPDRGMGLFRPVELHFYEDVALANVFVKSRIDLNSSRAALTVCADLKNRSTHPITTTVSGKIGRITFSQDFTVQAGETRQVALTPERNPKLNFEHAQLWWPWELGEPHLYNLKLMASNAGRTMDTANVRFGIREVKDYRTAEGYRGYLVNGKKILIRGGGWADELLLRENETNFDAQIRYARAMNLNTIRLEGIWGSSQRLFDLADQYGMLIMAGWSCQWEWPGQLGKACDRFGGFKSESDMELATNYLRDQVLWLRNHPSIYVWVLGSDLMPRPELERRYDRLLQQIDPTRPTLMTCGDGASTVSGPSGVKMNGPYDYETPNYWSTDQKNGGAFGYNTETGPGPLPPPMESLERMIPAQDLWPMDDVWKFHCARGHFHQMNRYWEAYTNRYGIPGSAAEFAFKSQAVNYEAIRPMFEAFSANLPHTTGIIQWMLNASWPKLYWQLYDYYLIPGGAFFGAKKGASPFAVIYNYADRSIYLVNQTRQNFGPCVSEITAYNSNSKVLFQTNVTNVTESYGSQKICDLSMFASDTPVYFLNLRTVDGKGTQRADNFYWLSSEPDVLDEQNSSWYLTTNTSWADFSTLNQLPRATVRYKVSYQHTKEGLEARVNLKNASNHLAFFIEMKIAGRESKRTLTPVFWSDNYISLPPHSDGSYITDFPAEERPELSLRGWNVDFEPAR